MDLERLSVIGQEVAKRVAASTGVDDIGFVVLTGANSNSVEVSGVIVKQGQEGAYTMNSEQVHQLLNTPEKQLRSFLQEYLEYVAHSVISSETKRSEV